VWAGTTVGLLTNYSESIYMYPISYVIQQGFPFFTWYQRGFLPQPSPLLLPPAAAPYRFRVAVPRRLPGVAPQGSAVGHLLPSRRLLCPCSPRPASLAQTARALPYCPPPPTRGRSSPPPPHPELSDTSSISHSSRLPWLEPCLQFAGTSDAPGSCAWPLRPLLCLAWWSRTPPVFPSEQPHCSDSRAAADDESPPPHPGLLQPRGQPRLHSKAAAVGLGASHSATSVSRPHVLTRAPASSPTRPL
jgi:hypothetical protein